MEQQFPTDRNEQRRVFLTAVDRVRDVLAANADETESMRTLSPASVNALRESGLLALMLPAELGGAETDPMTQTEVIEAVSFIDPSTGWSYAIGASALSFSAYLPDEAIARMFAGGRVPMMAGAIMPGRAVPVDGGYRVTGRWSWGSGVRHADWVGAHVLVEQEGGAPPISLFAMLPAANVEIHDMWHVAGLKGTGSCDFSTTDCFVPAGFTFDLRAFQPRRGGPLYRIGLPGLLQSVHAGFALGVGRRALSAIIELAHTKKRGYGRQTPLAERAVFQRAIGESDLRLRAARGLVLDGMAKAWEVVCAGKTPDPQLQIEMRSATTLATDVALDVATHAFRYGGGTAIHSHNILQRCLRDLQVGAAHLMVNESTYELHGQCLLGAPEVNPMG